MVMQESGEMYLETIYRLSQSLDKVGAITLTDKGRERAQYIFERHMCLTKMFTRLGVNAETAAEDACRVEHYISDETFQAIKRHLAEHEN